MQEIYQQQQIAPGHPMNTSSRLYPLYADLSERRVLVVGGGSVAERKTEALLDTGADIRVLAAQFTPAIQKWQASGQLKAKQQLLQLQGFSGWLNRWQLRQAVKQAWIVIAASDDHVLNTYIANLGKHYRVLTNVVDDLQLTQFHVPAVLQRGPMQAAISSAGVAPALARRLRAQMETLLDEATGEMATLLAAWRDKIKQNIPDVSIRRRWYDELLDGEFAELVSTNQLDKAERYLSQALLSTCNASSQKSAGKVILVGAGPGDPGLLTIQALRELQQADVIVHDRLVSQEVLNLARRDAERILVAKRAGKHETTQSQIHEILIREAGQGKRVVRLKGGDPFVFGRGGEELQILQQHNIKFAVVPGVSAAMACGAYAGVPLTHRDYAQSVRLVTAHCQSSMDKLDWAALAEDSQTLAVYMGVGQLELLRERLLEYNRAADTPFALIENGTRSDQRVITGQLADLPETAREHQVQSPAMLLLGQVAGLADQLHWYGAEPVTGSGSIPRVNLRNVA